MRQREDPVGPFRVRNAAGITEAIMPNYGMAVMHRIGKGDYLEPMTQEAFDNEMTDWHRSLAESGWIVRC